MLLILYEQLSILKPQSNGPLYSNTVIATLAVDGWVGCYVWYSEEGTEQAAAPRAPPYCNKCKMPTHQRPVYRLHII